MASLKKQKNSQTSSKPLLPVTVLSGFLGAGKTTLLNHVLSANHGLKVAVIVNDMSEVNIDAALIENGSVAMKRGTENLVSMQNGCICCTLREDLLVEVAELAKKGTFDYLLIESTGIGEPRPVAETFFLELTDLDLSKIGKSSNGEHLNLKRLADIARLDTLVTVIDSFSFLKMYNSKQTLKDLDMASNPSDERGVVDLLIEQIEFANVIVLNKCDLMTESQMSELESVIHHLNAGAKIERSTHGRVDPKLIFNTGLFDLEKAEASPGWLSELRGEHVPETLEYGISSFVYRSNRPFHPKRLKTLFDSHVLFEKVLRSKGFVWLSSDMEKFAEWGQAGTLFRFTAGGLFWAVLPKDQWPEEGTPVYKEIMARWSEPWGDRRQEIVFIGQNMDETNIRELLDACLLTEKEMALGPKSWSKFPNPLPLSEESNTQKRVPSDSRRSKRPSGVSKTSSKKLTLKQIVRRARMERRRDLAADLK